MRISFFNPKPEHFSDPCPRCQGVLIEQIRNKYELVNPGAAGTENDVPMAYGDSLEVTTYPGIDGPPAKWFEAEEDTLYPDEVVTPAPKPLCHCCEWFKATQAGFLCDWCVDCPTEYCDIPRKNLITKNNTLFEPSGGKD